MAETAPNQLASMLMFTPQTQAKLANIQQQQAMAQALLNQGITPIDTSNRQIGGVAYKVSPWEGVSKLADALVGTYEQKNANQQLGDLSTSLQSGSGLNTGTGSNPFVNADGTPSQLGIVELIGGNRAVGDYIKPTNEQKNFGSQMPTYINNELGRGYFQANPGAASLQTGLGTAAAGQAPVGTMPQGAPSMGMPQSMPSSNAPLPQASAMPPAPIGSPVAGNMPTVTDIPQVNASALQPPHRPNAISSMPMPMPGESNNAYQARLEAAKAGATEAAKVQPAADTENAKKNAENLADAQKTFDVAASNLPRAMQRFGQLRSAAKDASYGGGVSEEEPGSMIGDYARNFARTSIGEKLEPKTSIANQVMDQATKQGVLSELGPQLAGLKGNKFLESIASGASGLNLADPPAAKLNAINGLQDQYISNLKSVAEQRRQLGDPKAPSDMDLANLISQHADPSIGVSVISPDGKLGRVSPSHLPDLIQAGGQIR